MFLIRYNETEYVNAETIIRIDAGIKVRFMCHHDTEWVEVNNDLSNMFINNVQAMNKNFDIQADRNEMLSNATKCLGINKHEEEK